MSDLLKVQRNDSCPCGSGKKYKKCEIEYGIYEEFQQLIEKDPEEIKLSYLQIYDELQGMLN